MTTASLLEHGSGTESRIMLTPGDTKGTTTPQVREECGRSVSDERGFHRWLLQITRPSSTRRPATARIRFREHAADWRRATDGLSSPSRIYSHPDYLRIIAMGPRAIPWILADLRINGGEWYAALEALTGQNPVSPEDEGFVGRMDQAWLRWGQSHGYAV